MSADELPRSLRQGTVRLFGVDVEVHHLDDGRRIITADSMTALFEAMGKGIDGSVDEVTAAIRELLGAA